MLILYYNLKYLINISYQFDNQNFVKIFDIRNQIILKLLIKY